MAKNSIRDYSATNSSNTDIQSIDISEGCSPAGINNAIREVMADLKDVSTGAVALESPAFDSASLTGDLTFGDNDKAIFGAGSDLQIYHDGSNSYVSDDGTGVLNIQSNGTQINLQKSDGTKMIEAINNGNVVLYSNGTERIRTNGTGVDVTGVITTDGLTSEAANGTITSKASGSSFCSFTANTSAGNNAYVFFQQAGTEMSRITAYNGGVLAFSTGSGAAERMRIDSSGNLLLGKTASTSSTVGAELLPTATAGYIASFTSNAQRAVIANRLTSDGELYSMRRSGTVVGTISVTTTATAYNTSSDYRLKENVTADWDATTRLKQLNPVRFNFISNADITVDGFLAHEVQDIVPEAISGTKDAMRDEEYEVTPAVLDEDGNVVTPAVMGTRSVPDYQGIDQSKLVPLLVKTIQELEARITALEAN
jgi:hypothetical protein